MIEAAKTFEEYLKKENISGFQVREAGDDRDTAIFESEVEIEGRRLPIVVLIDATAYATIRIRLAQNAVDDTNAMLLTGWLMRQNQDSRLIKFYLTSDTTIIADVVVPHAPEQFDPDVMGSVLREADAHGRVRGGVNDDEDRESPPLDLKLALKDGGLALIARLTNLKARDVFLLDVFLECFGRLCHDQSPPAAVEIKIIITY